MRDHHAPVTAIQEVGLVSVACDCGWVWLDCCPPWQMTLACRLARRLADLHTALATQEARDA